LRRGLCPDRGGDPAIEHDQDLHLRGGARRDRRHLDDDITSNGGSIADAIDADITSGGTLPLSYQLLSLLRPRNWARRSTT